jgi:signal transduction histidine kinase
MAGITRLPDQPLAAVSGWARLADPAVARGARRPWVIATVLAAVLGSAAAEGGLWQHHPELTVVNLRATSAFVVTGLLLLNDPAQRGTAWAVIGAGIALPLGWLDQWETGPLPLYSVVFGYLAEVLGAWALLRYPRPALRPWHRQLLGVLAGWLILGPLTLALVSRPQWWGPSFRAEAWWPTAWPDHAVFASAQYVFDAGALVLALTFIAALGRRLILAPRADRVTLLPVLVAGIIAAIAAAVVVSVGALWHPSDELYTIEGVTWLAVPVGFLVSITQQRLVRMAELIQGLDSDSPSDHVLRQVLRANLSDPSLDLLIWSPADQAYRTVDGEVADVAACTAGRTVAEVTGWGGERLALLVADPSPARDRSIMLTAVAMSRLTLGNAQLSRRLLTADYQAREQLAADLHDGAQNKLCGLLVPLSAARHSADEATRASLDQISLWVSETINELRDLTHGVYPSTLADLGLRAAINDVAGRLDLLATVTTTAGDLPAETEKTLYFMICEAMTNVFKHARARSVTVTVARRGPTVEAVVADDGRGGADPNGAGLARMRDRAHAHGGALTIDSPRGSGTTLTMRIPCA